MNKEEKAFYKQLHHIIRLYDSLVTGDPIFQYHAADREWMLDIKRGRFPATKDEAFALRDKYIDKLSQVYEDRKLQYHPQSVDYTVLDDIVMQHYIKDHHEKTSIN